MVRTAIAIVALSCFLIPGSDLLSEALAQDFPYMVPQAPEFHHRGRGMESGSDRDSQSRIPPPLAPPQSIGPGPGDYRPPQQQVAPTGPPVRSGPRAVPQSPNYTKPGQSGSPVASTPPPRGRMPQGAPPQGPSTGQAPQRPDCTRYTMIIAHARSEQEMREAAREYLACLLQSGWDMETARKQVISVIETSYAYIR